jgi:ribonuclease HIII
MLTGNSLKIGLRKANIALCGLRAEPVFVREYNRLVAATHNKSTTAFDVTCRMLMWLWQSAGRGHIRITVDRQGGRVRYRQPLQRVFADCELKVLDESAQRSAYLLRRGDKTAEVSFVVGGESQSLPTALASMLSKYLRELFMECFNRYWAGHVADIEPTAGYYTDGRRFYGQIAEAMGRLDIAEDRVYRSR